MGQRGQFFGLGDAPALLPFFVAGMIPFGTPYRIWSSALARMRAVIEPETQRNVRDVGLVRVVVGVAGGLSG